jgi:alkylhydroperoxidase family enzyme
VKLTHHAAEVDERDIDALRAEELDDATISDAIQVIGYFNYVTRVADGVGIEDEPEWAQAVSSNRSSPPRPEPLSP